MNQHRYILEPYNRSKTRYTCPDCQTKRKTFVRYIDTETGQHIADDVGRCNRESKCGYHYTPKQYFEANTGLKMPQPRRNHRPQPKPQPVTYIPFETFKKSLQHYDANHLVTFLINRFGVDITKDLIDKYCIGTSKHWPGATTFWQMDVKGKIRTGKIVLYNRDTGKRNKDVTPPIYWAHNALKQSNFNLNQCLFGEHLLKKNTKPVAIVESEKTALIASVYLPKFVWLACGGLSQLTKEKCAALHGRNVVLYPDLNGFDKWTERAREFSFLFNTVKVSDLLECKATESERKQGLDLADYLLRYHYADFQEIRSNLTQAPTRSQTEMPQTKEPVLSTKKSEFFTTIKKGQLNEPQSEYFGTIKKDEFFPTIKKEQPETWNTDIDDLVQFFETMALPTSIELSQCESISNVSSMVNSHLAYVKANNGKRAYMPYLNRLQALKQILTGNNY